MTPRVCAFIAFGANLGDPAAAFALALQRLGDLPDSRVLARSSLYRTAPVGVEGQPDYINAVIELSTALPARHLLEALLAIEHEGGRTRDFHMAPRTMDLDLLLYGDAVIDEHGLQVPHPRMHLRAFTLVPLAEIAPEVIIPGRGRAADLLPGVADQAIARA
ncbi:MAG: 2-amino-4-hydroxy-6-hydroxymethyldihydropteridine diphosphokinase [Thauera propionica]|jgi:2-amino-4-hydroxy-6-hydroxymethyldihydropteridine diphosphokinase|uniref:2-amino-4-hydroxy-6-hydroxymethyldihydropteridine pyrophosphokinase n=1 Tax=Thauera propionica TaxID=2019431 RepID=A0A235EY26_9RHOO|nr:MULTISPECIES: 2-amino-4-hydroxy-6-hydroxymethyldihydropteridine diphosphokinase [Thauera]MDD3677166.1 2-amino-4-hydroxy-6-hydroxymethyldihydropteridine diphosphokinase [Thauera propionica]MDI3489535.1 2-amino-4-hydroxy-6-hydroxymethyldihydropteridine diphosphokinase [Thauera sp.]MDY0046653.1 2-amino-4-hydroxy-6-hydroxymethyldihydropteridine diphosphokinase [Thauera propionica]OYD53890.1 2-amino-4-hydroxy-6-hydroxymethyldihydropteridine diphosphokinase [Thauera propionica]